MKIKIKKLHESAVIPKYSKPGDAGLDLTAVSVEWDDENSVIVYKTGLAVEIPEGHVGLIYPRSSICQKDIFLTNSVGVIDSGYRGEIMFKFKPDATYWDIVVDNSEFETDLDNGTLNLYLTCLDKHLNIQSGYKTYAVGDRVGQLIIVPYPKIEFEETDELGSSERGEGGFGSSGK